MTSHKIKEIVLQEHIIQERNEEINTITNDINIINDIYKDLALLIEEQGHAINTIADNIEKTMELSNCTNNELEKAAYFSVKKRSCILM